MNHLITGGSGFLGNLVARSLHKKGEKVRILDIWEDPSRAKDIEYIECSVTNRDGVAKAMKGIDVVHHNAALVAQTNAGNKFWEVNVDGGRIVAEEAMKAGVQAFIHVSSTSVFGIPPDEGPITNDTPTKPIEPYGRSKLAGEQEVDRICHKHGIPLITIRPRAILGAGRLGIFQILFEWIKEGRRVYVIGSGNIKFQFVEAYDLIDFYMLVLNSGRTGVYNVGAATFRTLREDLEELITYAGSKSRVTSLPASLSINALRLLYYMKLSPLVPWHYLTYHKPCYFDPQPLLDLGWRPRCSNIDMFRESYDWFKTSSENCKAVHGSPHRSPLSQGALWLLKKFS